MRLAQELPFRPDRPRKLATFSRQELSEFTQRHAFFEPVLSTTIPLLHGIEEQVSALQASEEVVKRPSTKLLLCHLAIDHVSDVEYDTSDGGVIQQIIAIDLQITPSAVLVP